jgi:Rrf2 family iron-sulfur cluster assembly transcriptional regulator
VRSARGQKKVKITAQEEYGLRCILQLAKGQGEQGASQGNPLLVREIADREGLSTAYVEKILWTLSRSGIVESVRGPRGGYRLTRAAEDISIGEVMRVLGGMPSQEEICAQFTGNLDTCVHHDGCGLRPVWASITDFVHQIFDKIPITVLLQQGVDLPYVQLTGRPASPPKHPTLPVPQ